MQSPHSEPGKSTATSATELLVEGMTCGNCARHVTEAIQSVPGVQNAVVDLGGGRASIRWNSPAAADESAVIAAVKKAGYDAAPAKDASHEHEHDRGSAWQLNLWLGVLITAPLMAGEWLFGFGAARWFQWLSFFLAGLVQAIAGGQFYRGAWRQLKAGSSNMDTLVALGSTTAFGYSTWALLTGQSGHLYFMEAAAIITLVSLGHWVEARVGEKASSSLKSLMNLAPETARRVESQGVEKQVPVAELGIGDQVALRPGDRIPTDGEVVEGESAVDESMLTGESAPVDKRAKSKLYTGTINLNGRLVMRVTATGESTALANIIAAVQRAQTSRANIQRIGDRVSNVFVPVVVAIAIGAGLWWGLAPESAGHVHHLLQSFLWPTHPPGGVAAGFIIAAAVLIIACPCAMGLATPAAIMAGANAAARRGILIRDGVALEKAGEVTAVIFDKTGTLTHGKPEVIAIGAPASGKAHFKSVALGANLATSHPVTLAAALARHSTHPISQAIAKLANGEISTNDWREVRGAGVEARNAKGELLRLGSLAWLRESGINLSAGDQFVSEWTTQAATVIGLAEGQTLAGLFAVRDTLKPGSEKVIAELQSHGVKTFLVTGDNKLTAASIARQVGIAAENVFAEVRPEQKADFVKQLQARGERVAFVGDGINDAPALTQADLGIAVSRASDVAREAADIILLNSEIEAVPEALGLARATLRTIKQNLFWAFFYNAAGVPLAALGFMSPVLCAAAMGFSDLIVIGNALRLARWRKP